MLFLKTISHCLQLLNNLLLTFSKTVMLTSKLIKRELNLFVFTIQSVLGLTQTRTFTNPLSFLLTKKNYFLRDFVFLWQFNDLTNIKTQNNLVTRYTGTTSSKTQLTVVTTVQSTVYKTIMSNSFLFSLYNNLTVREFNTY